MIRMVRKSGKMTLYSMGNIRLLLDMENIQQDFMLIFQRKQITEKIWATGTKKVSVIGNVLEDTKGNRLESHTVSESGWIPVTERVPENDDYVLMSFENFSLPLVGRYVDDEKLGGAWYLGDCFDEDTCLANDLFVNAWMPLPEPYREDEEDGK